MIGPLMPPSKIVRYQATAERAASIGSSGLTPVPAKPLFVGAADPEEESLEATKSAAATLLSAGSCTSFALSEVAVRRETIAGLQDWK